MIDFGTFIGQYKSTLVNLNDLDYGYVALDIKSRIILDHSTSSIKIGDGTEILDVVEWDAASGGSEKGLLPLGIYKASPTNLADTDGDFTPLQLDSNGRLRVDAEVSVSTGSDKAEDTAHTTGDIGCYNLSVRVDDISADNSALLAGTEGDYQSFLTNDSGELYVIDVDSIAILTTIDTVLDNIYIDTQALVTLIQTEDTAHSTGDNGVMALAVANEAQSDLVSADGDYTPIAVDKKGNVYVDLIEKIGEEGTESDEGVDSGADGEVDVAYHATNFVSVQTMAVGAGEDLYIKGWDMSTDVLISARLVIYDDTTLTEIIRKINVIENTPGYNFNWLRAIGVTGATDRTVQFEARCMRNGKTAHVSGGINAYKR